MYRILTKLHTQSPSIYRFYTVVNEQGEIVEYGTNNAEEAVQVVHDILSKVGYADLKIVDDRAFYVNITDVEDHNITDEEIQQALDLLARVGYKDLDLLHEASYDVEFHWGNRPEEEPEVYALNFEGVDVHFRKDFIDGILAGENVENTISFDYAPLSFHLKIDGEDTPEGLPDWITYEVISDTAGILHFNNITSNHVIEIIIDEISA